LINGGNSNYSQKRHGLWKYMTILFEAQKYHINLVLSTHYVIISEAWEKMELERIFTLPEIGDFKFKKGSLC
jgi:hypothetical protein